MKKLLIRVLLIIFLIVILFMLTGCANKPSNKEFIKNGISLYEQIFNDEFTLVREIRIGSGTWGEFGNLEEGKKEIIVTSLKYPNKEIEMSFFYNRNTKKYRIGASNYNFIRYEEQLYKDIDSINSVYSEGFFTISTLGIDNSNLSYSEYINSENNGLTLTVYVAPGDYDKNDITNNIINILKEKKVRVYEICVKYVEDNDEYVRISNFQNKNYISLKYNTYNQTRITLDEKYNILTREEL